VQGYADLLANATAGQLSEDAQRYLQVITTASRDMGRLIDDMLAFSRMSRTAMSESSVDLDALVRDVIRVTHESAPQQHVVWQIAPLPRVMADPSLLRQALLNLIGNALKYSRQRDPARIEVGQAADEGDRVVLFVRDNGAGFEMQYAHKLFGVFQRLHRADEFEGTGIGLAIVQRIVARHGGRVWAEGMVGQGAAFYFTLRRSL
jgi:light-regulated signal transduction histidine kinase (bacteriophytochrome)